MHTGRDFSAGGIADFTYDGYNVFKEPVKIGAFNIQIIGDHMDIYFMGI